MTRSSIKIAATSPSFSKHNALRKELLDQFPQALLNVTGNRLEGEDLCEFIGDADGVIVGLESIDDRVLSMLPRLKMISKYGVGLDNIDCDACIKRGIQIGWTGGVNRLSVAEMTLGFMLALCRNIFASSFQLKSGTWNKQGGQQLSGKTVGIIGAGYIGKEVIRLLSPFNCRVLVNDIVNQDEFYREAGVVEASKEQIFRNADIVTIHTPLTSATRAMVNLDTLRMMKQSSFLINTARGPIVCPEDLKRALHEGLIAGAAIDVYDEEPPSDEELLALPNLICTPHIGGNAEEAVLAMGMSAIYHLREFFYHEEGSGFWRGRISG
ncbi:phosphoglycerate dehydrogenase [Geobacter sp. DSM 9736]|uniref:phosphoglycerate dehydrogenase n=1 Tax=Geobacter sp. DSM 9736 TaxID=1277350 RepID=UPI000B50D1B7|nr:phosphoglycerate dehydrogenase [Geobacter sp. DSM 9736]SNB47004.1 D-3-phosphoglycerate dehydrogenase [Geobacter sp. DSM 9736]